MTRYLCETCGTVFDEPHRRTHHEHIGVIAYGFTEEACPICGGGIFTKADDCPKCGGLKLSREHLCRGCRADLARRFTAFADELTAEEEEQLDEWLDGSSITDRGGFH